jgi:hypothetical protein
MFPDVDDFTQNVLDRFLYPVLTDTLSDEAQLFLLNDLNFFRVLDREIDGIPLIFFFHRKFYDLIEELNKISSYSKKNSDDIFFKRFLGKTLFVIYRINLETLIMLMKHGG